MTDIFSTEKRSMIMSRIRGKDTSPEMIIRSGLHKMGFRYRVNCRKLPGSPDLVFSKFRAVIFVHGCFWHRHDCHLFRWPASNEVFWRKKITGNAERDRQNIRTLLDNGWRVLIVWECALKGSKRFSVDDLLEKCRLWILSDSKYGEISSHDNKTQ